MNNDLFEDGIIISSFIKDSDRIWEGILVTRTDGIKTVFNEQTGRWKKLSDLDNIKILTEADLTNTKVPIGNPSNKERSWLDIKNQFSGDLLGKKPDENLTKIVSNEAGQKEIGAEAEKQVRSLSSKQKSIAPKDKDGMKNEIVDQMKQSVADRLKAKGQDYESIMKRIKKLFGIRENIDQFHPSLRKYLEHDGTDYDDLYYDDDDDDDDRLYWKESELELGKDAPLHKAKKEDDLIDTTDEEDEINKKSMKYEDKDYLDIPDEVKSCVMADIIELLKKNEENIEEIIKSQYEISDSDAEEFIIEAMERYLKNSDIKPKNSIKDITDEEIEKSLENSIDKYDGPENGLLDHLVLTYEIDPGEAIKIVEKTKGNLTETIYSFLELIKNKLREEFDFKAPISDTHLYRWVRTIDQKSISRGFQYCYASPTAGLEYTAPFEGNFCYLLEFFIKGNKIANSEEEFDSEKHDAFRMDGPYSEERNEFSDDEETNNKRGNFMYLVKNSIEPDKITKKIMIKNPNYDENLEVRMDSPEWINRWEVLPKDYNE